MKDLKIAFLIDIYGDLLTEKQKNIVNAYYNCDLSLSEIATEEGISRQAVQESIKKSEAELYRLEAELKIYEKRQALSKLTDELIEKSESPEEVKQISTKIKELI